MPFLTTLFSYFISLRYSSLDSRLTPQGDDFEAGSRTEAFFRAIKLDYRDAQLLFDLLDQDQSGEAGRIDRRCNQNQPDWSHQRCANIEVTLWRTSAGDSGRIYRWLCEASGRSNCLGDQSTSLRGLGALR